MSESGNIDWADRLYNCSLSDLPELVNEWKSSGICRDVVVAEICVRTKNFYRTWRNAALLAILVPVAMVVCCAILEDPDGPPAFVFLAFLTLMASVPGLLASLVSWPSTIVVRRRGEIIREALENE